MRRAGAAVAALLLALGACRPAPEPARPALWAVTGPDGERGWLLASIHALPRPAAWRSTPVEAALAGADMVVLEVTDSPSALAASFARLARTPGQTPATARVPPALRPRLARLMRKYRLGDGDFAAVETWAVALTLSRAAQGEADGRFGLEGELQRAARGRKLRALEGGEAQLRIFDRLPEREQRDLLAAVVAEADRVGEQDRLARAWREGDMALIARETRTGLLADPELREALLVGRNRAWAARVAALLGAGSRPLVAVGAAHLAGPEGLPALLAARGYKVRRLQ